MASPNLQVPGIEEQRQGRDQNPNNQSQEWETMARAWLSAFPEAKAVSTVEVESWIDSNRTSLPADLQSVPRNELIDRLLAIQNFMRLPNQASEPNQVDVPNASEPNQVDVPNASEPNQVDLPCAIESNQVDAAAHARFQRTDQWLPVYSWLESLDKDEVVKSKDISDWLTDNPEIREHLCSRHSRYHLMHYIKKCHMKILKRREKKKGLQQTEKPTSPKAQKTVDTKEPASIPSNPLNKIPKDSDLYVAKRNEALQKFEILLELEKKLSPHFSRPQAIRN